MENKLIDIINEKEEEKKITSKMTLDYDRIQKELIDVYFCDIHWEYISEYIDLPIDFIKIHFEKLNIDKLLQNKVLSKDTRNFLNSYILIL